MQIRMTAVAACLGALLLMLSGRAEAQYQLTNLVSNQIHQAPTIDPLLANAWGLARSATSPWWISDNDTGWSTIYQADGTQASLKVLVPTAGNGPSEATGLNGPGTPTGIVANPSKTDFEVQGKPSSFIFATLDGTISAWAPGVNKNQSIIAVDNSANKASYTGLGHHELRLGESYLRGRQHQQSHRYVRRQFQLGDVVWRPVDPIRLLSVRHPGHQRNGLRRVCCPERGRGRGH